MTIGLFILFILALTILDCQENRIPNTIVLPGILFGIYLTGEWQWALVMFLIGALLYKRRYIMGGDAKLLGMTGAFLGWMALPIFGITTAMIGIYRFARNDYRLLPYTPFVLLSSIGTIGVSFLF